MDKPHFLLLPYPTQGHINPMLQFAKRLASHNVRVTLALTRFVASHSTLHLPDKLAIQTIEISDGFDIVGFSQAKTTEIYLNRFRVDGSATLSAAIDDLAAERMSVHCIVYDSFLPWVVDVVKEKGLSCAAFFTQACTVCAVYYEVYNRGIHIPLPETGFEPTIEGVPALRPADAPSLLAEIGSYGAYLTLVVQQFSSMDRVDALLFNTFNELEMETEVAKSLEKLWPVKLIGPCIPSMYLDKRLEDDWQYGFDLWPQTNKHCIDWLDSKPTGSVVYASFGSLSTFDEERMAEIGWGLRNSGRQFLWMVKASEMETLPSEFRENDKSDDELVVEWCPQLEVLAHPAVGCFFTHCGWNSTLEALALGVPMVAMPQWTDQPTDAWLIESVWEVGVRVKEDENGIAKREEIEKCIKEVMEREKGDEIRRKIVKYKEMAVQAMNSGGSSDKDIKEFIALFESK